jgi:hypothetical protein
MNSNDPNAALLERAADHLGDALLGQPRATSLGSPIAGIPWRMDTAQSHPLPSGRSIQLVTARVFLATMLVAFHGRGQGNHRFSHDLEDLMAVLDGRDSLLEECRQSRPELQSSLTEQIAALLATPAFLEAMPDFLAGDAASQQRLPDLEEKLRCIVGLTSP